MNYNDDIKRSIKYIEMHIKKELSAYKIYYSASTKQQISSSIQTLHENWVSYIDIQKGILRAPDELKDMFEEYRENIGTLSKVVGGICRIDSVCPTKMACVGCGAKVPRLEFKEEILGYFNWAD